MSILENLHSFFLLVNLYSNSFTLTLPVDIILTHILPGVSVLDMVDIWSCSDI